MTNIKQLKYLTLRWDKVAEFGYSWLPQCTSLESVSLSRSAITDREVTDVILTLKRSFSVTVLILPEHSYTNVMRDIESDPYLVTPYLVTPRFSDRINFPR
eukprot:sb/3478499/